MNLEVAMRINPRQSIKATFDGATLEDCLHKGKALLAFDGQCGSCKQQENFTIDCRKDKEGNLYTEIACDECGYRRRFGHHKDGSGEFLKDWEAPYSKSDEPTQTPPRSNTARSDEPEDMF